MGRRTTILILLLGLACQNAGAQWYLFPGVRKKAPADTSKSIVHQLDSLALIDAVPEDQLPEQEEFVFELPQTIQYSLVLPFTQKGQSNSGMLDFYSGALLAARDMGRNGVPVDFGAYDCSTSGIPEWNLDSSDILVGPLSAEDILAELGRCPEGSYVISPLDPLTSVLLSTERLIQVPTGIDRQTESMVDWMLSEYSPGDRIVVIEETGITRTESSALLFSVLKERDITFTTINYGILQGLKIFSEFEQKLAPEGCVTRYLIASENESFVGDAIRNVGMMLHRNHDVALYCSSKQRSFPSIEQDDLHELEARTVAGYFIDYDNPDVKSFTLAFRSLFQKEPNAFAFSGYDITRYFLSICWTYGINWEQKVEEFKHKGLQADFDFVRRDGYEGIENVSVRRIRYNKDNTTTILQ